MSTQTFPSSYHYIDITPLVTRFDILMASVLAFIAAGQMLGAAKLTQKIRRIVRLAGKLEMQNVLLKRKLEMLMDKDWRERVLKQLGGKRRLKSWEAAAARNTKPCYKPAPEPGPIWLYTDKRRAESERLKAHVRKCARACVSPGILRDRIRMDFEGQFRLAPLPRRVGAVRQERIYTQASICDYFYNAMPYYEMKTFGPATVWPAEFRAAAEAETVIRSSSVTYAAQKAQSVGDWRIKGERRSLELGPASSACASCGMTELCDCEDVDRYVSAIPTRHVIDSIGFAAFNDLFYAPLELPP